MAAGSYGGMATGAQMNAYAADLMKDMLERQEMEKQREQRIGDMQRAATMAQHMDPDTMAGLFVGQLLGNAINNWMEGSGGGDGGSSASSPGAEGADVLAGVGQSAQSPEPLLGGSYGNLEYSPELAQADYMMTGNPGNFGLGGTPSKELENEILQNGIENTMNNRAPFDNQVAANDTLRSLGILGNGFSPSDYSLKKKIDDRFGRGWR